MVSNDANPGDFMTLLSNSILSSATGALALCLSLAWVPDARCANGVAPPAPASGSSTASTVTSPTKAAAVPPTRNVTPAPATTRDDSETSSNKVRKTGLQVSEPGSLTSIEGFNVDQATANSLGVAADYALKQGQISKAIKLCRQAIYQNADDVDIHQVYAEALEKKLQSLKTDDISLYNECVKQWLLVFRSDAGEERGVGFRGLGVSAGLFCDEERNVPAKSHLIHLVGRAPRAWESNARYLKVAMKPHTLVAGRMVDTK